ncbi:MAG: hypothetical protein QOG89_3010 [Thermomicrobiales bacterium]|nr:hypothetical protein [Thermomicrobiales bacterium]
MKTIRVLRQERGWTQFEVALKVGVQPQAVYLWESGRRTPQVPQMRKLGELFGICSDEIDLVATQGADDRRPDKRTRGRMRAIASITGLDGTPCRDRALRARSGSLGRTAQATR